MKYDIYNIEFNAEDIEQLGTKEKFWFRFSSDDSRRWLFKFSRKNTGEHWSEKAAEQLCKLIGIPHVKYELARCNDRLGIISPNAVHESDRMVMGNEVLHNHSPAIYPKPVNETETFVRVKEHTISRVLGCLDRSDALPPKTEFNIGELNAGDVFCGYLMLDALISNQDRHHENWALIIDNQTLEYSLCPSYDHAASLGRELLDEDRTARLNTKDKNRTIENFVQKARSEIFKFKTDKKPLFTVDAFFDSIKKRECAKVHWLTNLEKISKQAVLDIFTHIPDEVITDPAREFAVEMILQNKKRLLENE